MSDISEEKWKKTLTTIIEELDKKQYAKMLSYLEIPEIKKTSRSKVKMPGIIIQQFGVQDSIKEIEELMEEIPRRDSKIQSLLRPFVDKLNHEQDKENQGKKRKREEEEESKPAEDHQKSSQPDKDRNTPAWQKSICDVKSRGIHDTEGFIGKVVQKSGLHKYKTKEKEKKFFFYLAVADNTGSVKVMVYGKEHYKNIKEDNSYLFRNVIQDPEYGVKVTKLSTVSRTKSADVPEELEVEARKLIYPESPVCNIAEAKSSDDKTEMSVEGTVTDIKLVENNVKVKYKQEKTKKLNFQLKDETDSIWICMWGEATNQCKKLSVGDIIKVTNLKTHVYFKDVTLNSTGFTKIHQVKSVGVQNLKIEIKGIIKATKTETQLDVEFNDQLHTFAVSTPLLAKAFDFSLQDDVEESLLDKMPLFADAEIQGSKISKITAVKKM